MAESTFENIGNWSVNFDETGKTTQIIVSGDVPTDGTKPLRELKKKDPQGINPTELILYITFGEGVIKNGVGRAHPLPFKEAVTTKDQYKTILILADDRSIAKLNVSDF